jgi:hypothetical protein
MQVERRDQPDQTVVIGDKRVIVGGKTILLTPPIIEDYWSYRVILSDKQAIIAFPKFRTIGIGFAVEDDWNTNLPYTQDAEHILEHIAHNKGDPSIKDTGDVSLPVPNLKGYDGGALSPSLLDRPSHGLWSLWEMLELCAQRFVSLLQFTARMELLIGTAQVENEEAWTKMREAASNAAETCEEMGLHLSAKPLRTLAQILRSDSRGWPREQQGYFRDAVARIRDELSAITLLSLSPKERELYDPPTPPFGSAFETGFASGGTFELDEAAKCLALERGTASVFHLMRLMEIAVRSVSRCLSIPDPVSAADRNWGTILKKVREGIDAKWPTTALRLTGDGEVFDALYASLDAVKNPWRNSTMHPANKYTQKEAEHVFAAVRGFAMKLASRCDENGDPKA